MSHNCAACKLRSASARSSSPTLLTWSGPNHGALFGFGLADKRGHFNADFCGQRIACYARRTQYLNASLGDRVANLECLLQTRSLCMTDTLLSLEQFDQQASG